MRAAGAKTSARDARALRSAGGALGALALAGLALFGGLCAISRPAVAGPPLSAASLPEPLLRDGITRVDGFDVLARWSERMTRPQRECRFTSEPCLAPSAALAPMASRGSRLTGRPAGGEAGLADLKAPREPLAVIDAETLVAKFAEMAAPLVKVRLGEAAVPRIFLQRFPHDLAAVESVQLRKAAFIHTVLPLVLQANQDLRRLRARLVELRRAARAGVNPSQSDRRFLAWLEEEYEVEAGDLDSLLRRVDVVPPSLALAQGAEESGWGTSRFARRGNAVFGQRTFREGRGMVPLERVDGERHEVVAFDRLETSVRAYMWNLNTHPAYDAFRRLRAGLRQQGQPLDGAVLIGALARYSERGEAYIETIRAIMDGNAMAQFDRARLDGNPARMPGPKYLPRQPASVMVPVTF